METAQKTLRVAIYVRVSSDARQRWKSVTEQETECRAEAARRGWEVVEVFCDNDRSASRFAKRQRPDFLRLQQFIADGHCDVLLSWEGSRNQRDLAVFVQLRNLLEANGVLWAYDGDVLDMRKARDRKRAAEDATDAEYEADRTSERVRRHMRASAAAGRPHGRRLFGYQRTYDATTGLPTGQDEHPDEAPVVRRIFAEYLSGSGIRTIAVGLNADGITTGTGATWKDSQVRRVLGNPAYIAQRVHQGQIVGSATWPALVDAETFERTQARLASKRDDGTRQTKTARLLTGVGRCGKCGGKLNAGHDRNKRKVYQCRSNFCVVRDLTKLDTYVTAALLERLSSAGALDSLMVGSASTVADDARSKVTTLRAQLDDAVEQFAAGALTAATLAKIEARILPAIAEAEREARRAVVPLDIDVPSDVYGWWDSLTPEQRREIVGALVASVIVRPTVMGTRRFDVSAATIEWRHT